MPEELIETPAARAVRAQDMLDTLRRDVWKLIHPDATHSAQHTSSEVCQALRDRLAVHTSDKEKLAEAKKEIEAQRQQLLHVTRLLRVWRELVLESRPLANQQPTSEQILLALSAPVTHLLLAAERERSAS